MKAICTWVERFGEIVRGLDAPETRDSFVRLNDKPVFGVEIDWEYARRYAA